MSFCHFYSILCVLRLLSDIYIEKDTPLADTAVYEKRGTLLLPVPLPEVFELTRFIETSNEDPTPYVYNVQNISFDDDMDK